MNRPCPIDGMYHGGVPADSPDRYCSFCMSSLGLRRTTKISSPDRVVIDPPRQIKHRPSRVAVQRMEAAAGLVAAGIGEIDRRTRRIAKALRGAA